MSPTTITLLTIFAGVAVVLGSILLLRLHAFIALSLGALTVAALTPRASVESFHLKSASRYTLSADDVDRLADQDTAALPAKLLPPGESASFVVHRLNEETGQLEAVGTIRGERQVVDKTESAVVESPDFELQVGDLLVLGESVEQAGQLADSTIAARVTKAFGTTCAGIGLLIAMASIVGKCLLESGAADRIVRSSLNWMGEKRAPIAFVGSGFLLGVPVFFDTVFYLMIPLGKALHSRTGRNYLLYVLTIVCGATMAHSLVPPTPGPLLVASELNIDLGLMIMAGTVVGIITASAGCLFAVVVNRFCELPMRDTPDMTREQLAQIAQQPDDALPPLWLSLLPIVLPVVLIGGQTILKRSQLDLSPSVARLFETLGDKNIALIIAAVIGVVLVIRQKGIALKQLSELMQPALASAGVIILITAAGGAFGKVLQQTGVAALIRDLPSSGATGIVVLAFAITTAIRTAQGSATVAMITAVGILAGLADDLPFDTVYLALAIGCGSKPFAWMADSGFWVITRMSGMTEVEGLRYITPLSAVMGFSGLAVVVAGVNLWPHL